MKNKGDKTMKKVLLTSAAALAAFTVASAVSADTNLPGKYDGRSDFDQEGYYRQSDFITARRVNQYVEGHSEDIAAEKAALDKAKADLKAFLDSGYAGHDYTDKVKAFEAAIEKAQADYDVKVAAVRNEAVKHLQEVWNTAVQKEGKYFILNETPEQRNARYFKEHGQATQGWAKNAKGQWTYLKDAQGNKATGWLKDNDTWYYLDKDGIMQTGWVKDNGTWYYLDGSGAMQKGWKYVGGDWYYLDGAGAMQTGWKYVSGHWYYLNASGALLVNTTTPDGYTVNASGELV